MSSTTTNNKMKSQLGKKLSFADMSDGKPGPTNIHDIREKIFSLSLIARGDQSNNLHREKSMNCMRYQLGLYANYPLANAILCGADKR